MKRSRMLWALVAIFGMSACSKEQYHTAPFGVIAASRITGVVSAANGKALASIRVFVAIPNSEQAGYASAQAVTNSAGRYVIDVRRMNQLGSAPIPDTLRVQISAQLDNAPTSPIVKTERLLTFSGNIAAPPTQQLDLRFDQNTP
ncbi:MAG: hypothetical protein ABJC26_14065 [Gemmatimonadaceae bacterium]